MEEIHTNSNQFIASQMDEEILHETRSEEVQEIIGTMPHWIIRCGIGILTSIVLAVFLGCAFVKLPEYVGARVSIMPSIKPTPVSVKASGIIQNLLVNDGGKVNKGQVLAIIDNNSHYTDVLKIKEIAIKIDTTYDLEAALLDVHLETRLHIGELQQAYSKLYIAIKSYRRFHRLDDVTFASNVHRFSTALISAVKMWEAQFLIVSPCAGTIYFIRSLDTERYISEGQVIMTVVPTAIGEVSVTGSISSNQISKLKIGQNVLIEIPAYPSQNYGFLEATISKVWPYNSNEEILFDLIVKDSFKTTKGFVIPVTNELGGTANIEINERTILNRLISFR